MTPAALLMYDSLYASTGFRIFRSSGPTPENVTQLLVEVKSLTEAYAVHPNTCHHLFSTILYAIGTEAFNSLLLKKDLCNPKRGISIRYNISMLEQWCNLNGYPEAVLHFQPLSQFFLPTF